MILENISSNKLFEGWHKQYTHPSSVLNCEMRFAIYLPPQATSNTPVPVMYWLSGLTCSDENFMQKAGAQRLAAELGIAIVAPDTSPRGEQVADDQKQAYDLGLGAGFYLNATQAPWNKHYQMYDYVVHELPKLIEANFPVTSQRVISGHSMGGHGALTIGLRNPSLYTSISAFSPICNPINCPWGQKAFTAYLGEDREEWKAYDSCEILSSLSEHQPILIDQGSQDSFLQEQLKPENLSALVNKKTNYFQLNMREGYDHSYYFISSFIESHLRFHALNLGLLKK
ncbi:S-formylglutathione hydrolase [Psychromonas sp. B3M02]|uniref:S-formylglutathione hydrolase n=1 Tax=Psychromonas sp. B3M02 TaxID=2267226 RepID=UPI000DE8075C|nr:S-formylglutathione hydrolase [Psychromonas sp. B3M02]RBW47981.1 S-formylglutathione hydrolase [Psychromonas sp. B3M02]